MQFESPSVGARKIMPPVPSFIPPFGQTLSQFKEIDHPSYSYVGRSRGGAETTSPTNYDHLYSTQTSNLYRFFFFFFFI
jgi:hypothetical protein